MLIDNIDQDIEIKLFKTLGKRRVVGGVLKGYITGLPFKDGDVLMIEKEDSKNNLVGVNGKKIEIDMKNSVSNVIIFHYI